MYDLGCLLLVYNAVAVAGVAAVRPDALIRPRRADAIGAFGLARLRSAAGY